jgi:enoyl-CoA hydratase
MNEVLVDIFDSGVALLSLNRPEKMNALNLSLRVRLAEEFEKLSINPLVKSIVITGNKDVFAAGADLADLKDINSVEMMHRKSHQYWQAISNCPKPVIAAVNGFALGGGCELAMHADIIIAGENSKFGQPEIRVGIMPGAGGTQRLLRSIGKSKAMLLLLTGQHISGIDACRDGLVSEVVSDDDVLARSLAIAETIARMPPLAVQQIKEVILAGQDMSLESALMLERKAFQLLLDSEDKREGIQAFFDKRQPNYSGN